MNSTTAELDDDAVRVAFASHRDEAAANGEKVFSRRRIIALADFFGVKPMAMVWRLEKLKLLARGAYGWFKANGGITSDHVWEARVDQHANALRDCAIAEAPVARSVNPNPSRGEVA